MSTNNKFIASSLSVFVGWVTRDKYYKGHAIVDVILTLRGGFATIWDFYLLHVHVQTQRFV